MKKLTRPQTAIAIVVAAVVLGGSIYAYTEKKKAYEHEQRCLSLEGKLVKLGREIKENNAQLHQLVITDGSGYAASVFMLNKGRIEELMARNNSLGAEMYGGSAFYPTLIKECGQPRAAKLVKNNPDLFP
jgi:hypothetical protein